MFIILEPYQFDQNELFTSYLKQCLRMQLWLSIPDTRECGWEECSRCEGKVKLTFEVPVILDGLSRLLLGQNAGRQKDLWYALREI